MNETEQFVAFECGSQAYAIEIGLVQEIIKTPPRREISSIGTHDGSGVGMIDLRGAEVVPVIDLRKALGKQTDGTDDTNTVICSLDEGKVGFVVDSVRSVVDHRREKMTGTVLDGAGVAVLKAENELIVVVDPMQVIDAEEAKNGRKD